MKRFAALVAVVLFTAFTVFVGGLSAQMTREEPAAMLSLLVTDARGRHVPSLARDDIQLSIGGVPVDLDKFIERGVGGAPAGEMRRIAVLFDVGTLSMGARRQASEALHGFFARTLRPGDLVVILAGGHSLRAMTTWTSDLTTIDAALERVSGESSTPLANSQAAAEKRIREIATDIQQADARGHTLYTFDALIDAARGYASARYRDAEESLDLISSAMGLFTPRTRNVLILAGGSLPRSPGAGVFQYVETLRTGAIRGARGAAMQKGAQFSSPLGESSTFDMTLLFHGVGTRSWRRGVAIYAINSEMSKDSGGGSEARQSADSLAAFTNEAGRVAGYQLLAEMTGGMAFVGRSAVDALDQIASDLESFYTVGVHPTAPISGRDALLVKVRNGYPVRVMRGSAGSGTPADEMESRVIANHLIRPVDNALGISLNAAPPVADGERRFVTVDVIIPIRRLTLVQDGNSVAGAFTVFIATGDTVGNSSRVNRQTRTIRWPAEAVMQAGDKTLTFRVNVVLEPGRSQISVGVMDEQSHEKGFDRLTL
jgi:VWFA-related protein